MKPCPFCANDIQDAAIKCQYCGEFMPQPAPANESAKAVSKPRKKGGLFWLWVFLLLAALCGSLTFRNMAGYAVFAGATFLLVFSLTVKWAFAAGDWFRRFTMPSYILTSGAMQTFWTKLFWVIGPQCIAVALGAYISFQVAAVATRYVVKATGGAAAVEAFNPREEASTGAEVGPAAGEKRGLQAVVTDENGETPVASDAQRAGEPTTTASPPEEQGQTVILAEINPSDADECLLDQGGTWKSVGVVGLRECVQQAFSGRCGTKAAPLYARWSQATLQFSELGVRIADDDGGYYRIAGRGPACPDQ